MNKHRQPTKTFTIADAKQTTALTVEQLAQVRGGGKVIGGTKWTNTP